MPAFSLSGSARDVAALIRNGLHALVMWRNAYVVVCSTHFGIDIAELLASRRCYRRRSCRRPHSVFFLGRPRKGFHSPTWFPRFRLERELLGFSARPSAGFGSRTY